MNLGRAGQPRRGLRRRSTAAPTTSCTTRCPSSASTSTFIDDPDDLDAWRAAVQPEHQGVLRRDHRQPPQRRARHRGRLGRRPRGRRAADRRQHRRLAVADPPARVGRRHRRALRHQVHRRPRHLHRRRDRRRRHASTSRPTTSSRCSPSPTRATTASQYWPALGTGSYIIKARVQLLRDMGAAITPVQLVPVPAGPRDAEPPHGAPQRQRQGRGRVPRRPRRRSSRCSTPGSPSSRWHERATRYTGGRGYGSVPAFVIKGGKEAGPEVRRGPRAAQPRGQHRRRAQPRHPPGEHHPLPAHRGRAGRRPASSRAWCACRSASRRSTTSSPTSSKGFAAAQG